MIRIPITKINSYDVKEVKYNNNEVVKIIKYSSEEYYICNKKKKSDFYNCYSIKENEYLNIISKTNNFNDLKNEFNKIVTSNELEYNEY